MAKRRDMDTVRRFLDELPDAPLVGTEMDIYLQSVKRRLFPQIVPESALHTSAEKEVEGEVKAEEISEVVEPGMDEIDMFEELPTIEFVKKAEIIDIKPIDISGEEVDFEVVAVEKGEEEVFVVEPIEIKKKRRVKGKRVVAKTKAKKKVTAKKVVKKPKKARKPHVKKTKAKGVRKKTKAKKKVQRVEVVKKTPKAIKKIPKKVTSTPKRSSEVGSKIKKKPISKVAVKKVKKIPVDSKVEVDTSEHVTVEPKIEPDNVMEEVKTFEEAQSKKEKEKDDMGLETEVSEGAEVGLEPLKNEEKKSDLDEETLKELFE